MTHVQPMMCGTCANENAIKRAFIGYMVSAVEGSRPFIGHSHLLVPQFLFYKFHHKYSYQVLYNVSDTPIITFACTRFALSG